MMREIKDEDLVGKTIKSISNKSVNVLKLEFTDGTKTELWTDAAIYTPHGSIYGIFIEDEADNEHQDQTETAEETA